MTMASRDELTLICHPDGTIARVLTNDLGAQVVVGASLTHLLLRDSWVRCQRFLHMAARHGAALGCELTVCGEKAPRALRFAAIRLSDDALLVAAARSAEALLALLGAYFDPHRRMKGHAQPLEPQCALDELTRINSELVNSQRELAKEQAVIHAQARRRRDLLATVAHDLRTPMMIVLGYCELLEHSGDEPTSETRGMIQRVCAAVQYALNLLSQTLEYAKVESGELTLHLEQTDLCALTRDVIEMHSTLAARKNIRIALHPGRDTLPSVRVDPVLIQQTIGNLLTNAIKYSPRDTTIEVSVKRSHDQVCLSVKDQGLGIEPSFLPILFRPFQTTSTQATGGEKSTGLGLAIVQKLVEAHGGTVEVRSAPKAGSTFAVKLPLTPPLAVNRVMALRDRDGQRSAKRRNDAERMQ